MKKIITVLSFFVILVASIALMNCSPGLDIDRPDDTTTIPPPPTTTTTTTTLPQPPDANNILLNSEFETRASTGTLPAYPQAGWQDVWANWTENHDGAAGYGMFYKEVTADTYSGRNADNIHAAIFYSAANQITGSLVQTVSPPVSGEYLAEAWIVAGSGTHEFTLQVSQSGSDVATLVLNVNNQGLGTTVTGNQAWQDSQWKIMQLPLTLNNTNAVTYSISCTQGAVVRLRDNGYFKFDSLTLKSGYVAPVTTTTTTVAPTTTTTTL